MRYLIEYELKRDWKRIIGVYLGIGICLVLALISYRAGSSNLLRAQIVILAIGFIIIIDRRVTHLAKNIVFEDCKHMMLIPKSVIQIVGANAIVAYLDCFILGLLVFLQIKVNVSYQLLFAIFTMHIAFCIYVLMCNMYIVSAKAIRKPLLASVISLIMIGIIILMIFSGDNPLELFFASPIKTIIMVGALSVWGINWVSGIVRHSFKIKTFEARLLGLSTIVIIVSVSLIFNTYNNKIIDDTNIPIVLDDEAIGTWQTIDFVNKIEEFSTERINGKGRKWYFDGLVLNDSITESDSSKELIGYVTHLRSALSIRWTKGYIINYPLKDTASKYTIRKIDGETYMFMEWKSGDYVYRHHKPSYYVFKKVS